MLGQAITLVESTRAADQELASQLIDKLLPATGKSVRIGITGVPGVGKSTFIETFGKYVITRAKKVAVLTIDPSSQVTRGSILGDKTRMEELARHPQAFIRPTSSGNTLGGVAHRTREAMLLCEAAGYDVILIETVGVGQSEVAVKGMVDFFLLLMLAGAGDELQGIKKGIMEMADAIVITKADGANIQKATEAQRDYQHALHLFPPSPSGWTPPVLTASSTAGTGIGAVWEQIERYRDQTQASGYLAHHRQQQHVAWMHDYFQALLQAELHRSASLRATLQELEQQVSGNTLSPHLAARRLLHHYHTLIREQV